MTQIMCVVTVTDHVCNSCECMWWSAWSSVPTRVFKSARKHMAEMHFFNNKVLPSTLTVSPRSDIGGKTCVCLSGGSCLTAKGLINGKH